MLAAHDERLSRITTMWTLLGRAHGTGTTARDAQELLMERYYGAVYKYLRRALQNEDAAEDLFQEFALRFIRGDFRGIDPARGRFRNYLRTVLVHLIDDHFRTRSKQPRVLPEDWPAPTGEADPSFIDCWKKELLDQAWAALKDDNADYHAALLLYVRDSAIQSSGLADALTKSLRRDIEPTNARVMLHRARQRFARLVLAEVKRSLSVTSDREELIAELKALGLYNVCRSALGTNKE